MGEQIIIWLIMLASLYFIIKWAVRTAILEADDIRANTLINSTKASKTKCPTCEKLHDVGHSKCPHCLHQY